MISRIPHYNRSKYVLRYYDTNRKLHLMFYGMDKQKVFVQRLKNKK